jgi:3-oxoacyl-[acyl-carrier protein] reductase
MDLRLEGKRVLLTGGTRGIGRGISLALAQAGASLLICYRADLAAADLLRRDLKAGGHPTAPGDHEVMQADVTDPADVTRLVQTAQDRFGALDALITCGSTISHVPFAELELDEWRRVVDGNLTAVSAVVRAALPLLHPGSSVIAIGSRSALVGVPQRAHYTAAKAGLIGLTRSLAKELGPQGVRVNLVAPGIIAPEQGSLPAEVEQLYTRLTALGRLGRSAEVAGAVLFLASDLSSYVTGETLNVDGGI